ncbi:hypothetical protein AB4072_16280 [Microvirga sp. 2MCAF38]|uniref:hypothetical protein n=1 Tax=Microvirga sp. 2MCAF38 TaxID=3232989 RepID=UPI003F9D3ADE
MTAKPFGLGITLLTILCTLAVSPGADAQTKPRKPQVQAQRAPVALPEERSFLDPGPISAPGRRAPNYVADSAGGVHPIYDRFGNNLLPQSIGW